jgi:hypothetical protein
MFDVEPEFFRMWPMENFNVRLKAIEEKKKLRVSV